MSTTPPLIVTRTRPSRSSRSSRSIDDGGGGTAPRAPRAAASSRPVVCGPPAAGSGDASRRVAAGRTRSPPETYATPAAIATAAAAVAEPRRRRGGRERRGIGLARSTYQLFRGLHFDHHGGDVVLAAALIGQRDRRLGALLERAVAAQLRDLLVAREVAVQPVAAQEEPVPGV